MCSISGWWIIKLLTIKAFFGCSTLYLSNNFQFYVIASHMWDRCLIFHHNKPLNLNYDGIREREFLFLPWYFHAREKNTDSRILNPCMIIRLRLKWVGMKWFPQILTRPILNCSGTQITRTVIFMFLNVRVFGCGRSFEYIVSQSRIFQNVVNFKILTLFQQASNMFAKKLPQ